MKIYQFLNFMNTYHERDFTEMRNHQGRVIPKKTERMLFVQQRGRCRHRRALGYVSDYITPPARLQEDSTDCGRGHNLLHNLLLIITSITCHVLYLSR